MGDRASHWREGARSCPCGCRSQTIEHVLWDCPLFSEVRDATLASCGWSHQALVGSLPALTLHALLLPACPEAVERDALMAARPVRLPTLGPQLGLSETVWTDGGGLHPGIPGISLASWAVWWGPSDTRNACGIVDGVQTAQRGELQAALIACRQRRGPLTLVTDSRYVAEGFKRLRGWAAAPDAKHGDLWAALWAAGAGTEEVVAKWVPAHQDAPSPPLLTAEDWRGNRAADALAGDALRAWTEWPLPAAYLAAARAYPVACEVGAKVFEAYMVWARAPDALGRPRIPYGNRARRSDLVATAGAAAAVLPLPRTDARPPSGVHDPVPGLGENAHRLTCRTCSRVVLRREHWGAFLRTRCGHDCVRPTWDRTYHVVRRTAAGGAHCVRCGRKAKRGRASTLERSKCPALVLRHDWEGPNEDWGALFASRLRWCPGASASIRCQPARAPLEARPSPAGQGHARRSAGNITQRQVRPRLSLAPITPLSRFHPRPEGLLAYGFRVLERHAGQPTPAEQSVRDLDRGQIRPRTSSQGAPSRRVRSRRAPVAVPASSFELPRPPEGVV